MGLEMRQCARLPAWKKQVTGADSSHSPSIGLSLIRLGVFVLEVALLTSLGGASAGQRMMKLRVLSWPDYLFVKPGAIFIRTFLIALVIPAVVTDKDGRGLHDRITKTVVMRLP
jgi:uncharacterized RDD family membrane protein YckC